MKKPKNDIRFGLLNNHNGKDIVLITTDIDGILELKEVFLKLANGKTVFHYLI